MARRWTRQELYADQLAYWRNATLFEIDLTDPITPVVLAALDEDDDPALVRFAGKEFRIWPKYRYTLDLRSPILREVRGADRKRLEQTYAETFARLRVEVQSRLEAAAKAARRIVERLEGGKVTDDDLGRFPAGVRWTETRAWPFVSRKREVRVALDAEPAPHQALGAALAYLHPAVRIRLALADPERIGPSADMIPEPKVRLGVWSPGAPRLRVRGRPRALEDGVTASLLTDEPTRPVRPHRRATPCWEDHERRADEYLRQARLWLEYWMFSHLNV